MYLKATAPDDALKHYIVIYVLYTISNNPIMAQERLNGNFKLQQYPGMHKFGGFIMCHTSIVHYDMGGQLS